MKNLVLIISLSLSLGLSTNSHAFSGKELDVACDEFIKYHDKKPGYENASMEKVGFCSGLIMGYMEMLILLHVFDLSLIHI